MAKDKPIGTGRCDHPWLAVTLGLEGVTIPGWQLQGARQLVASH